MAYSVTTYMDNRIPSWAGNGAPFTLIACHDTEGAQGRVGAMGTIQFLIDAAYRGASYHEIWWYHESTDEFGVIKIVPASRAAGSIGPQQPPTGAYWPTQWVRNALGVGWWDPNQGVYAVSIAGRVADVDRYSRNPKFLDHAHRRMLELQKEFGIAKRAEHFQFQPSNRSDWGRNLMTALGGLVTPATLSRPEGEPMIPLRFKAQAWTAAPTTKVFKAPDTASPVIATLAGGPCVTIAEEATKTSTGWDSGNWRLLVLSDRAAGWVQRSSLTPVSVDHESFANLVAKVVFETDLSKPLPAWPPEDTTGLKATIQSQTGIIAGLKTDVATAEQAAAAALARAEDAEEAAADAVALRTALQTFLA